MVTKPIISFLRDVPDSEIHFVGSGHFALEPCCGEIAGYTAQVRESNYSSPLLIQI